TLSRLGCDDPRSKPAARRIRKAVGGLFRMNLNEPSEKMVISAGTISPMRLLVRALYSLQKPIRLMPCCARAGPIGGAGLAFPAWICKVTTALTFLAMFLFLTQCWWTRRLAQEPPAVDPYCQPVRSGLLDLQEVEL